MTTIILAAGLSSRMGANKLLLEYRGRSIIEHTVEIAAKASDSVIVVTGNDRERTEERIGRMRCRIAYNDAFMSGQASSVRCGLRAAGDDDFAFIPGDLPLLSEADLESVFLHIPETECVRPEYMGIPGHPIAYRKENRERLLAFPGNMKEFNKTVQISYIRGTIGTVFDIDTAECYDALLRAEDNPSILNSCLDRMRN